MGDDGSDWSARLTERYRLQLPSDLKSWFDRELWREQGPGEFFDAVSPKALLDAAPESIWPPLMPPFFLPLIRNRAGDWLCLRLRDANGTTDVCHWYHGGGDWIPWGNRLAEAIWFDAALPQLPSADQRYANPAERPRQFDLGDQMARHTWLRWAADQLAIDSSVMAEDNALGRADVLIREHVAEIAVRCQCVIEALANPLQQSITPTLAAACELDWFDLMQQTFDLSAIPETLIRQFEEHSIPAESWSADHQDWKAVAEHAEAVTTLDPDLAWAHEILGYAQHRKGQIDQAVEAFSKALRCSVFTDQSVRLRTHWATSGSKRPAKWAAYYLNQREVRPRVAHAFDGSVGNEETGVRKNEAGRSSATASGSLYRIADVVSLAELMQWYLQPEARRVTVNQLRRLASEIATTNPASAASLAWSAGWDVGAEPMSAYGTLLDELVHYCEQADWPAHAAFAAAHRRCLRARYQI